MQQIIKILFLGKGGTNTVQNMLIGLKKLGYNTLSDMMANAGILMVLSDGGNFTIFAPTDDSIQKFLNNQPVTAPSTGDKEDLKNLLLNHVVPRKMMAADLQNGMKVKNLANNYLEIHTDQDGVTVGGAKLGKVDQSVLHIMVHELLNVISSDNLQDPPSEQEKSSPRVIERKETTMQNENAASDRPNTGGGSSKIVTPGEEKNTEKYVMTTASGREVKESVTRSVGATSAAPLASSVSGVYSKCFEAKGCFGMPEGCVEKEGCRALVTFQPSPAQDGRFDFVLQAQDVLDNNYVAVALSRDMQMGDDLVFACSKMTKVSHKAVAPSTSPVSASSCFSPCIRATTYKMTEEMSNWKRSCP